MTNDEKQYIGELLEAEDYKELYRTQAPVINQMLMINDESDFEAFLKDDLYLKLADHANKLIIEDLKQGLEGLPVTLSAPLESNQAFLILKNAVVDQLLEKYAFAVNKDFGDTKEIRLVTCFISTHEEIASFIKDLKSALS